MKTIETLKDLNEMSESDRQKILVHEAMHVLHGNPSSLLAILVLEEPRLAALAFRHAVEMVKPTVVMNLWMGPGCSWHFMVEAKGDAFEVSKHIILAHQDVPEVSVLGTFDTEEDARQEARLWCQREGWDYIETMLDKRPTEPDLFMGAARNLVQARLFGREHRSIIVKLKSYLPEQRWAASDLEINERLVGKEPTLADQVLVDAGDPDSDVDKFAVLYDYINREYDKR